MASRDEILAFAAEYLELDALLRTLRQRHGVADTETTIILRSGPPLA